MAATCDNARCAGVWSSNLITWLNSEFRPTTNVVSQIKISNLLCEVAGFIDIAVSFPLQLVDDLALFLRFLLVVLDLLLQVVLGLLVEFHEVDLLLRLSRRFQHVLYANSPKYCKINVNFILVISDVFSGSALHLEDLK